MFEPFFTKEHKMITKRYNKPGTGEKGFTLIEILTAILIIIVGLLAVGSLQLTAISGNSSANKESIAKNWNTNRERRRQHARRPDAL